MRGPGRRVRVPCRPVARLSFGCGADPMIAAHGCGPLGQRSGRIGPLRRRRGSHARARLAALAGILWLAGCHDAPPAGFPGYVEGEYVRVASPLSGTLLRLAVERGTEVA